MRLWVRVVCTPLYTLSNVVTVTLSDLPDQWYHQLGASVAAAARVWVGDTGQCQCTVANPGLYDVRYGGKPRREVRQPRQGHGYEHGGGALIGLYMIYYNG